MASTLENYIYEHEFAVSSLEHEQESLNTKLKALISTLEEKENVSIPSDTSESDNSSISAEVSAITDRLSSIEHQLSLVRSRLSAAIKFRDSRWTRVFRQSRQSAYEEYKAIHTISFPEPPEPSVVSSRHWHPTMPWYVE